MQIQNLYNDKRKIYLFCRDNNGNQDIISDGEYYPYYYQENPQGEYRSFDGKLLKKVFVPNPWDVRKQGINAYQSDVRYEKQYIIDKIPTFTQSIISWIMLDIEILCSKEFPSWQEYKYPISCITLYHNLSEEYKIWFLGDWNNNERLMLDDFVSYLSSLSFDLMCMWNGDHFDYPYIFNRVGKILGYDFAETISPIHKTRFGVHKDVFYPAGISVLDYMELYKKFTLNKKPAYNLDYTLENEFGIGKEFKTVDFSTLNEIVKKRNFQDVEGMVRLEEKNKLIPYYDDIRRRTKVLWEDLPSAIKENEGKKEWISNNSRLIDMLVLQEAKNQSVVLPNKPKHNEAEDVHLQGAFREAFKTGVFRGHIYKLDLGGAYPNSIISFCLDKTNITDTPTKDTVSITLKDRITGLTTNTYHFKQNPSAIIPTAIKSLLQTKDDRKYAMEKMDPNSEEYHQAEVSYASIKSLVNSYWGAVALKSFRLFDERIANTITFLVRDLILYTKEKLNLLGYDVVYADTDSVAKDTPVVLKTQKGIEILPIEDLFLSPKTNTNSNYDVSNKNYQIWTDKGWTKIKYVYRHKTKKIMYRILTRKGYVECSEDHSLVINNKSIKPSELKIGDTIELFPFELKEIYDIDIDIAWLIGFWLAEGSCGKYKKIQKTSWHLNNQNLELLNRSQKILFKMGIATKIIDCRKSSSTYRLVADGNCTILYELFNFWCLSKTGYKKIPSFILESQKEAKQMFLRGYWEGDGYVCPKDKIESISSIDKPLIQGTISILESLGYDYSLYTRPDKPNVIALRIIRDISDKRVKKPNKIIKIEEFKTNENIYDIETENHHFCGGIGSVNLHNSVFCVSSKQTNEKEIAQLVNKIAEQWSVEKYSINSAIRYDCEGYFDRLLIISKCHYYGYLVKKKGIKKEIKGIEVKRVNESKFVKSFQEDLFENILNGYTQQQLLDWIKSKKQEIKQCDFKEFSIPAKLPIAPRKNYPIHIRAYDNTKKLNPKFELLPGEMFWYLYVYSAEEKDNVIAFTDKYRDHVNTKLIDWKKMTARNIDNKVEKLFEALGWEYKNNGQLELFEKGLV